MSMILNTSKLLKFFSVVNKVEFDLNFRQFYAKLRGVDLRKRRHSLPWSMIHSHSRTIGVKCMKYNIHKMLFKAQKPNHQIVIVKIKVKVYAGIVRKCFNRCPYLQLYPSSGK